MVTGAAFRERGSAGKAAVPRFASPDTGQQVAQTRQGLVPFQRWPAGKRVAGLLGFLSICFFLFVRPHHGL
jgi:hypothetical protein